MPYRIRPLADRVVVRPIKEEEEVRGGVIIPDVAQEKPNQGEVLAVGPGSYQPTLGQPFGSRIPVNVQYTFFEPGF